VATGENFCILEIRFVDDEVCDVWVVAFVAGFIPVFRLIEPARTVGCNPYATEQNETSINTLKTLDVLDMIFLLGFCKKDPSLESV
jgi:hypothetical protein